MIKPLAIVLLLVLIGLAIYFFLVSGRLLNEPESIAFDSTGQRFLISNVKGKSIVSMDLKGKMRPWLKSGLSSPRGLAIWEDRLYAADGKKIAVISLKDAKLLTTIKVPDAMMLNDLAFDKHGLLYVTDTAANCLHLVDPATQKVNKINSPLLKSPNGIVYDMPRDQMFIVGFTERSSILSLSTKDLSIRIFVDSIYSNLDGIAIDDLGRIYFSSWTEKMIIEIPQEQNRFIAKFKDLSDAADIFYYLPNNELLVPLMSENRIQRISLDD